MSAHNLGIGDVESVSDDERRPNQRVDAGSRHERMYISVDNKYMTRPVEATVVPYECTHLN